MASPSVFSLSLSLHPVRVVPSAGRAAAQVLRAARGRPLFVVTEARLLRLLAPFFQALLPRLGNPPVVTFPGGEARKTRRTKERLEDALLAQGLGRDGLVVAVGGGVVTDLAGFTAATFMRGVPYVSLPTTLLGMVDASLGGKTAVNTPRGKNLVGVFHPPQEVVAVLECLATLPLREIRAGLAECLKHGLMADADYFEAVAGTAPASLRANPREALGLVARSIALKGAVLEADPFERSGARNALNLGHTVAHALERASGWRMGHGPAVAAGLCWEAALAAVQGFCGEEEVRRVAAAVRCLGLDPCAEAIPPGEVFRAARADKKNARGEVRYIPLQKAGRLALPPPHTAPFREAELGRALRLLRRS